MWLGLTRHWSGRWVWEDDSEPVYTNWLQTPAHGVRSLCAAIDGRRGGWVTRECMETQLPFYCEAVPGESPC